MKRIICTCLALGLAATSLADWTNAGGNAQRNGLSAQIGPDALDLLWSSGPSSVIAWEPFILGERVFVVRQTGFPATPGNPGNEPGASFIYAIDLNTGQTLWTADVPYTPLQDWTIWLAGARDGRVYASRSGNGASISSPVYAFDAVTGQQLWVSQDDVNAGHYDGVVFAPDGDLIIGDFTHITRINAEDGATVWRSTRLCSVSSSCGAAIFGDAAYVVEPVFGGHVITRFNLSTGAEQYSSLVLDPAGFTTQNTPFVGPDGTIYLSRTQNNVLTDFFFALSDDGAAITQKWEIPARWTTFSEHGVGPDGSVYMIGPGDLLQRLDPNDGSVIDFFGPLPVDGTTLTTLGSRMAIDQLGRVYYSNTRFTNGRVYSFDADLTLRWSLAVPNVNIGAPSLGTDGTLLIAGVGTNLRAYRSPDSACVGDVDGDGVVCQSDLNLLLAAFGTCAGEGGYNPDANLAPGAVPACGGDEGINQDDLNILLSDFLCGGCN